MAAKKEASNLPTEVVEPVSLDYVNKELEGIGNYVPDNFAALVEYAEQHYGEIIEVEGSPWQVIDKAKLVGVPFMIADARLYDGKFGEAIAVMLMTEKPLDPDDERDKGRYVINDGSTGVKEQLLGMIRRTGRKGGIMVSRGLRASEYMFQQTDFDNNPIGPEIPATTYYLG